MKFNLYTFGTVHTFTAVVLLGYMLTGLISYLLGSIPTGFLMAKAKGVDIRAVGSGNIGATNVLRILGTQAGVAVLLADALKGVLAVMLAMNIIAPLFVGPEDPTWREWFAICGGVSAVLGHNYTCWLHFKGGKGIATSAGVLGALVPWSLVIILGIWIVIFVSTRYVSLASICASFALPFATWLTKKSLTMILVTAGMAALAIFKHRANIKRLMVGTENRFTSGRKQPPVAAPGNAE